MPRYRARKKAIQTFDLIHNPPRKYLSFIEPEEPAGNGLLSWLGANAPDAPLWKKMWIAKLPEMVVILGGRRPDPDLFLPELAGQASEVDGPGARRLV